MYYVYADGFRGFKDYIFEMKAVNFFVGENSTGKSSILALIHLLADVRFPFDPSFNIGPVELGTFNDVRSSAEPKRDSFCVGYGVDKDNKISGVIYVFAERDGQAVAKEVFMYSASSYLSVTLDNEKCVSYMGSINGRYDPVAFLRSVWKKFHRRGESREYVLDLDAVSWPAVFSEALKQPENMYSMMNILWDIQKLPSCHWMSPIRTSAKRIYTSFSCEMTPDGQHIPLVIKKLLAKDDAERAKFEAPLNYFGRKSGLFSRLKIKKFGKSVESPFGVQVELDGRFVPLNCVGHGVSQSLPIVVDCLNAQKELLLVQQPEVHLHPRAQAALGETLWIVASSGKMLVIETHSDYLIDRFRIMQSKSDVHVDAQVVFFKRGKKMNVGSVIGINAAGGYEGSAIVEFRSFFVNESMDLLEM